MGLAQPVAPAGLAARTEAAHNVGEDGRYITNRKHVKLCEGFQDGSCTESDATKHCARDKSNIHQCSICLSDTHGAHACRPPSQKGLPKGKGFQRQDGQVQGQGQARLVTRSAAGIGHPRQW